jgi:type I restriction enzyme, S subunit
VFYFETEFWPHDTTLWVKDFHGNDPRFVYYFLKELDTKSLDVGSANPTLNRNHVHPLETLWLSLPDQKAISSLLGALDDKIELNRQTNRTLEELARSTFKSWFVDFEPVQARVEGRNFPGLTREALELFPNEFEDSSLGDIPRGWNAQQLDELALVLGGGTPKTNVAEFWGGDIPWYSVVDAPSYGQLWVTRTEKNITQAGLKGSSTRLLSKGTTILSARGTVGKLALAGLEMTMNQSCYALVPKPPFGPFFTFFTVYQAVEELQRMAYGSVFDTIVRATLHAVDVVQPPSDVANLFEQLANPLLECLLEQFLEIHTLESLRDTLLPRLLSGELRVRDAERQLEGIL